MNGLYRLLFLSTILIAIIAVTGVVIWRTPAHQSAAPNASPEVGSDRQNAGSYALRVHIEPDPPQVGINRLTIDVVDPTGQAVRGANVRAVGEMPAMGAMSAMQAPVEISETAPGIYAGDMDLSMEGPWPITVSIETPTLGRGEIVYEMATGRPGLTPPKQAATPLVSSSSATEPSDRGTIHVDARRRQLIGLTTAAAQREQLDYSIRAAATVNYDETRLRDIALKYDGWIGELKANALGIAVRAGDPLFTVYSPALLATQEEYLEAVRRQAGGQANAGHLRDVARRKLQLWDWSAQHFADLEKRGSALDYVTIYAPANGIVIDKRIVPGSAVRAGDAILRLADVSRVWVDAQIYEFELPLIQTGAPATVTLPHESNRAFSGRIAYVYPYLQNDTRTARARIELDNAQGLLRPDMYVQVNIKVNLGPRLVVPEQAVLYAGDARLVFVDLGDGRLAPRRVKVGVRTSDRIEILDGLQAKDVVVTAANFLIASESKLKSGVNVW